MSFVRRRIDVTLSLGNGSFGETGQNAETFTGLRVSAQIEKAGMPAMDKCECRIWGLSASTMNQFTSLGKPLTYQRVNGITLSAGDDDVGMSVVYNGTIQNAYQDFSDAPNVSLNIQAWTGTFDTARPVPPQSYKGTVDAAVIANNIAASMGRQLQNNGVSVQLSNHYLSGTALEQFILLKLDANFLAHDDGNTIAIWPKDGSVMGQIPLISLATGLVGYPQYTSDGIMVKSLFFPGIVFGGQFELATSITPAKGLWYIGQGQLSYDLESEMPGGAWFQEIPGYRFPTP